MRDLAAGVRAVAGLTVREVARQRLWLLLVAAVGVLLVAIPHLRAVDEEARLKLSVAVVTGTLGFVLTLLAVLVGAATVRRDVEQRTGFLLFSKPLPRGAYLGGRWLGVLLVLASCAGVLGAVGIGSTRLQLGALPEPRRVAAPVERWRIENGVPVAVDAREETVRLAGSPQRGRGEGMRWRFEGLPPERDLELLVKAGIGGYALGQAARQALVAVAAAAEGRTPQVLELAEDSPYGRTFIGLGEAEAHQVVLRDRPASRDNLAKDYARLVVPREAIGADGSLIVQLNRLEGQSQLALDRGGVLVAHPGGTFAGSLLRGVLVLLAQAALLCAAACAAAPVARIGTVLLACLTLYFAGNALAYLREGLAVEDYAHGVRRIFELVILVLPDFGRYPVEARLAAGETVEWATVAGAAGYYGAYAAAFLVAGWLILRRAEL